MSWFSSIVLRLYIGSALGFAVTLALSYFHLGSTRGASHGIMPWLMMLGPLVLAVAAGFLVPDLILRHRWKHRWLPEARGEKPLPPEKRRREIRRGLRELTSPWMLPPVSRKRTREFTLAWSRTLLRKRVHEDWAWDVHALVWYALKDDPDTVEQMRSLIMESEKLGDAAFDVGLSVLDVREADVDLAILLAREGMERDTEHLPPERQELLENMFLAAYARDESLRERLLPMLTERFLDVERRDEVAGRIYVDAFIHGYRSADLADAMRRTGDVLARTGRSPEMTANLRALAVSAAREAQDQAFSKSSSVEGTTLRAPKSWGEEEEEGPHSPEEVLRQMGEEPPVEAEPGAGGEDEAEQPSEGVSADEAVDAERPWMPQRSARRRPPRPNSARIFLIVLIGFLLAAALAAGAWLLIGTPAGEQADNTPEPRPQPVSPAGTVTSDKPFTIQVAALPTREQAVRRLGQLREQGVDAYYVITQRGDARWFRVRIGAFNTTRSAQAVADSLRRVGTIEEYFVATFEPGEIPEEVGR